nr:hypothetical protein CFP56_09844 [Quercus suber]
MAVSSRCTMTQVDKTHGLLKKGVYKDPLVLLPHSQKPSHQRGPSSSRYATSPIHQIHDHGGIIRAREAKSRGNVCISSAMIDQLKVVPSDLQYLLAVLPRYTRRKKFRGLSDTTDKSDESSTPRIPRLQRRKKQPTSSPSATRLSIPRP